MTATVAADYAAFRAIRGLQITGRASRLTDGRAAEGARALLVRRYPFLAELASAPPELRAAFERASSYELQPESITLIDNTRAFGYKETFRIA